MYNYSWLRKRKDIIMIILILVNLGGNLTMVIFMNLPDRIKEARENSGFTQQKLAEAVGVTKTAIYYYEKGRKIPSADVLKNIALALNVSADYLLGLTDDPRPKDKNFNLLQYLSDDLKKAPQTLRNIADTLYDLAEKLEREVKFND